LVAKLKKYCRQKKIHFFGDFMLLNVAPLLLNCHLLGKTSTKRTNVIFEPIGYSESTAVLPAGRKFGRITQKEPCKVIGLTNPRPNFGQIFPERAKKGPNSSTILSL
jgi:hypothetical protein